MKTLVERVTDLEGRVGRVERWLGLADLQPARPVAEPETVPVLPDEELGFELAPAVETPAPAPAPAPAPVPGVGLPKRRRRRAPKTSLRLSEADIGGWLLSRLGGLALVLAAGFLFHYAATRGLLTPAMRVVLGFFAGAVLVAGGEWQSRRLKSFSAALTGAGVAILYVTAYAGFALYGFYSAWTALGLATLTTVGGVVQARRHDVEAVAGLAAAGGFLAPALVLNLHAQPTAILVYVFVLNAGLGALRARTGWRSPEIIAWVGTPIVTAIPLASVPLARALFFLVAYVGLFAVRPRLQPEKHAPVYSIVLSAVTAAASYVLFELHETPGWAVFTAGLALVLGSAAFLGAKRAPAIARADLFSAAGLASLAILDGFTGWHVTLGWSLLACALLLTPLPRLRKDARHVGRIVALLAVVHVGAHDALFVEHRLLAFLAAAAAVGAINTRGARWGGVLLASLGLAVEIATRRGASPWLTLLLLEKAHLKPTTRLLALGTLAALPGLYAYYVKQRRALFACLAVLGMLLLAEILFHVDGRGFVPAGLVAALVLVVSVPHSRSIVGVAAALGVAVAFDLLPPPDYWPFLNRRAFAVGSVLGVGWFLLRGRPEGTATALMAGLLAAAEVASVPDRAGGANPWGHLLFHLRTVPDIAPVLNARFLFLAGAATTAFVAARRWRHVAVAGHVYLVTALGVEVVGLVAPGVRSDPWQIFWRPGTAMGPHLALTAVILVYGAALVATGFLRDRALARRIGLGFLIACALKVSLVDLTGLGELYRVGSFLLLGATYLGGSYAYNRLFSAKARGAGGDPASGPGGAEETRGTGSDAG